MTFRNFLAALLAPALLPPVPGSAAEVVCRYCREDHGVLGAALTDKPGRKYARDRFVDVLHLKLDVTPDFAKRTVQGTATLSFTPIARPLERLELDATVIAS